MLLFQVLPYAYDATAAYLPPLFPSTVRETAIVLFVLCMLDETNDKPTPVLVEWMMRKGRNDIGIIIVAKSARNWDTRMEQMSRATERATEEATK